MGLDLFAGLRVTDLERAVDWVTRLLGDDPAFRPNDVEAVWELAEHRYLYVEVDALRAGHAQVTLFVDDLAARVEAAGERGVEPASREAYENGVTKVSFHDPDGNEVGIGGAWAGE